jgi:hypothetical protein
MAEMHVCVRYLERRVVCEATQQPKFKQERCGGGCVLLDIVSPTVFAGAQVDLDGTDEIERVQEAMRKCLTRE